MEMQEELDQIKRQRINQSASQSVSQSIAGHALSKTLLSEIKNLDQEAS